MDTDLYEKLLTASFRFLSIRPRSRKETKDYLYKKLIQWHVTEEESGTATKVIMRLEELGYLDDSKFTHWLVESRRTHNPKGKRFIKYELLRKGVNKDLVEQMLSSEKADSTDISGARKAIEKKMILWQKLPLLERKKKLYGFLGRRGFGEETIRKIVDDFAKNNYNTENP